MNSWKAKLYELAHLAFRVCPVCGSTWAHQFLLCQDCEAFLQDAAAKAPLETRQNQISVLSLWHWEKYKNRPLSILLESLKKHRLQRDWRKLAECLSTKLLQQRSGAPLPHYLVPCPAKTPGSRDHAYFLTAALAEFWQIPVLEVLDPVSWQGDQKDKSRSQRTERQFRTNEKFSLLMRPDLRVVFVDDIVTSGATAKAAFEAVGRPFGFEVWCLAHRRLAGPETL